MKKRVEKDVNLNKEESSKTANSKMKKQNYPLPFNKQQYTRSRPTAEDFPL